jgi:hypothetical protein
MEGSAMRMSIPLLVLLACAAPLSAQDHQHHHPAGADVGTVSFETSCDPAVRSDFERAVAMLHSFWFEAAETAFGEVAAADPGCSMAHWGLALTYWGNPFVGQLPIPARFELGAAAARRAVELAAGATAREQAYARAAHALYEGDASLDAHARLGAHAAAMRELASGHGDDAEAVIFLGRALVATAPASDLEFTRQREAAELLEPLFVQQPHHPGVAHYLIHAFDAPPLAEHGLEAALVYASIAPSAPHALHMPSHIFTRLGRWDESIETNLRSAAAEPVPSAAVHPLDYLVYAYLQQGRDAAAHEIVSGTVQLEDRFYGGILGYNFAAMPARYALERSAWSDAARLELPTGAAPPFVAAITHFARGIGAARSSAPARAREEAAALERLRDELSQRGDPYWPTVVDAQRLAVAAWIDFAEGRVADALRTAARAAEVEESVEKHPVTPGPLLPARELYGDMLMELERYADAQHAYERNLQREPRRARSTAGAARAAERAGAVAAARSHYEALLELMTDADSPRPELRAAREFLGRDGARPR